MHQVFPALTYERIEFSANILLFVPLGVLLMLILRRRYLILPIALVVTVGIESAQALLLDRRTPSMTDIIANTTGACIGMLIIAVVETVRARSVPAVAATPPAPVQNESDAWAELGLAPRVPPRPPLPQALGPAVETVALPDRIPPVPPLPGEKSRA